MAYRIALKAKVVQAKSSREIHIIPYLLGRRSRAAYALMDSNQKQEFWKRRGKVVLGIAGVTGGVVATVYFTHLENAPMTNRRRFMLLSLEDEIEIGAFISKEMLDSLQKDGQNLLPKSHPEYKRVEKVWDRLVQALPKTDIDQSVAKALHWNLNVIDSPEVSREPALYLLYS